jgi:hypothetical protein
MRTREQWVEPAQDSAQPMLARGAPVEAIVRLQRSVGNRMVRQLLRDSIDAQVPVGVTAPANALPPGSVPTTPGQARVVANPALPGGWTDASGATTNSGSVGATDRILLEGISGSQG